MNPPSIGPIDDESWRVGGVFDRRHLANKDDRAIEGRDVPDKRARVGPRCPTDRDGAAARTRISPPRGERQTKKYAATKEAFSPHHSLSRAPNLPSSQPPNLPTSQPPRLNSDTKTSACRRLRRSSPCRRARACRRAIRR